MIPASAAGRLLILPGLTAACWLLASQWVSAWSERFYLTVPWLLVGHTLLNLRGLSRRQIRARLAPMALGVAGVLGTLALDLLRPSVRLQPFERSVIAYTLLSILIVAAWIWILVHVLVQWMIGARVPADPAGPQMGVAAPATAPSRSRRRMAIQSFSIVIFATLLHAYLLGFLQIHRPKLLDGKTPREVGLPFQPISWLSRDGTRIAGWFVPAGNAERSAIVCHGVGAGKSDMMDYIVALHEGGFNVLAFDFRGHGQSGGHTVTYGREETWDIIAAVDCLKGQFPQASRHVVGAGRSMGAASLIMAAAQDQRIGALHIDAAYARTFDVARVIIRAFPPPLRQVGLYGGTAWASVEAGANLFRLAPVDSISGIAPRPILLVHGAEDRLIPIEQGRRLFAAAREPKIWHEVPAAGHCATLIAESPQYEQRMVAFLAAATNAPTAQTTTAGTDPDDSH